MISLKKNRVIWRRLVLEKVSWESSRSRAGARARLRREPNEQALLRPRHHRSFDPSGTGLSDSRNAGGKGRDRIAGARAFPGAVGAGDDGSGQRGDECSVDSPDLRWRG